MTLVTIAVVTPKNGKAARTTREKLHPLVKANVNPATVIAKARMMVPIFSPRAFWIASTSFPSLAESSLGLVVSNHALSYLRIDSRYAILIFLATLSLNINRKA